MDEKLTLTHTQYVPKFPKLSGKLSETYLNLIETCFEGHIESDSSKVRTLLCSLPIEIVDQVTSICSKAQLKDFNIVLNFNLAVQGAEESFHTFYFRISKLHKRCDFDNDTRMIEKLITCSLNDNIRRKLNKHKHEGLDKMMKLRVELDGSNIKLEISDTNYIDKNEIIKNDSKTFNSRENLNNFRPSDINSRNYQNSNFRNNESHSRNFSNNQFSNNYNSSNFGRNNARLNYNYNSNNHGKNTTRQDYNNNSNNYGRGTWQNNNNSNYYGRNSMWHNNNNANNYDKNNAWQNNNNSNYYGRNSMWHNNNNANNYDRNNAWQNNNNSN
ncbi:probable ATP-dependent RNA helicase ddx42 [Gordionus sp. m RMFG-2023]|uniref:probable ATP-dependent RNA helicase ddx42 n=1 Tax=Gordionus sp. m RMFG-2023 TaxID=3053472 RepID=UPI0031FC73D5